MKILFFAQSRQAAGCDEWQLETKTSMSPVELWSRLVEAFPDLEPLRKSARLARFQSYLDPDDMLEPQDEIAVIPPVSGG
jgi:molybdopterin converting factor subunit 1